VLALPRRLALDSAPAFAAERRFARMEHPSMNTKSLTDRNLRKSLKVVNHTLTPAQRNKLRRARAEKHIGLRAFMAKEAKA
jgi:hypothetical protein